MPVKARSLLSQIRMLIQYREMLFLWTGRELRTRYRQSLLGFGWAVVQPVFQTLVISIIFGIFIKVPSDGFPYPVFAYTGVLPWLLFSSSVGAAVPSVVTNMQLLSKIYFPREILPLSAILTRVFDFLIGFIVFAGLILWQGIPLHATLLYVPLLLIIQTLLAVGIGLLGAAISVFVRDITFALPFILQLWMYATPVIYPVSAIPESWRSLYMWNPMAGIIDSYRRVILSGEPPNMEYLGLATAIAIALCLIGYSYFKKLEVSMSDVL
jgi:lipopolysaccharide transport system permease protein